MSAISKQLVVILDVSSRSRRKLSTLGTIAGGLFGVLESRACAVFRMSSRGDGTSAMAIGLAGIGATWLLLHPVTGAPAPPFSPEQP